MGPAGRIVLWGHVLCGILKVVENILLKPVRTYFLILRWRESGHGFKNAGKRKNGFSSPTAFAMICKRIIPCLSGKFLAFFNPDLGQIVLRSLIILLLKDGGDIVGIQVKVISNILYPHMFIIMPVDISFDLFRIRNRGNILLIPLEF